MECSRLEIVTKTDLAAMNHLATNGDRFVKLSFTSTNKLMNVKKSLD
jgi:DNA polymerase epsilon subunit 1